MSIIVLIFYSICILLFLLYLIIKRKRRMYIISPFNIGLFIYTFGIVISPIFYYSNVSWRALGVISASSMEQYLNKAILINSLGEIILLLTLMVAEFDTYKPTKIIKTAKKIHRSINPHVIDTVFAICVIIWHLICAKYCNGYPLFSGKRTFYLNTPISPVYLFLNETILMFSLYYAIRFVVYKKKPVYLFAGIITISLQGTRASLITNLLLPIIIIYVYQRVLKRDVENKHKKRVVSNNSKKNAGRKVLMIVPVLALCGLLLQLFRKGISTSFSMIVYELFFGNTFSDLRDGAYILKGFENAGGRFLLGKTYLAALISFVPSSFSEFRYTWTWGRFTTTGLFGLQDHFGLRGGSAMEAYINFSWVGVIIIAIVQAIILSRLEKIFYEFFIIENYQIEGGEYFVFYIIFLLYGTLSSSSSAYNFYALIVLIGFLIVCSSATRKKQLNYLRRIPPNE